MELVFEDFKMISCLMQESSKDSSETTSKKHSEHLLKPPEAGNNRQVSTSNRHNDCFQYIE